MYLQVARTSLTNCALYHLTLNNFTRKEWKVLAGLSDSNHSWIYRFVPLLVFLSSPLENTYPMFFMLYILNNHMEKNHWVKTLLYCTQLFYVLKGGLKYMIHSKVT